MKVKGLSTQDILNMEYEYISSLEERDLRTLTSRLISTANKRVRAFQKKGLPLNVKSYKKGGKFSIKEKNKKQVLKEFQRVSEFLNRKSTTLRGYKRIKKEATKNIIGERVEMDEDLFWDTYKLLYHEGRIFEKYKYQTFDEIRETLYRGEDPDLNKLMQNILRRNLDDNKITRKEYKDLMDRIKAAQPYGFSDAFEDDSGND